MNDQPPCYMAFLLRLWCVIEEDSVVWRASLEDAHTGERRGFADAQFLCAFLKHQLEDASRKARSTPIEKRGDLP